MKRIAVAAALGAAFLWIAPALAENIGGVDLQCAPQSDRAGVVGYAQANGYDVITFKPADTEKMLAVLNAQEPVSTLQADGMIAFRNQNVAILGFDIGDRFCLSHPLSAKLFDNAVTEAIGSGA